MKIFSYAAAIFASAALFFPTSSAATAVVPAAVSAAPAVVNHANPGALFASVAQPSAYEIDLLTSPGVDAESALTTSDNGFQLFTAPLETELFHVAGITWSGPAPEE